MKYKGIFLFICFCIVVAFASCGSSGSTNPATNTISLTLEEATASVIAKAYGTKAVDPSNWTVSCVSTNESGTKTVKSGAWNATTSNFVVQEVPNSQDTVCYLAESGVAFSTLQYTDTNAVGSRRDASKITSDGSGIITYTEKQQHIKGTVARSLERNSAHFNEARDHLDKWADDMVVAAEKELRDTKEQLKALNREARKALTLEEQEGIQKKIQELEKKKRKQRQEIFDTEDDIQLKRNNLITDLEKRMTQKISNKTIFTIRWKVI